MVVHLHILANKFKNKLSYATYLLNVTATNVHSNEDGIPRVRLCFNQSNFVSLAQALQKSVDLSVLSILQLTCAVSRKNE